MKRKKEENWVDKKIGQIEKMSDEELLNYKKTAIFYDIGSVLLVLIVIIGFLIAFHR